MTEIARLSSIITVERYVPDTISLVRETSDGGDVFITLSSSAEAKLRELLNARHEERVAEKHWRIVNARTGDIIAACLVAPSFGAALVKAETSGFVDYDTYAEPVTAERIDPNTHEVLA